MYLQIVVGEDLELYYTIDNITLFVTPNVQTVKADVYSIGPDVTLLETKVSKVPNWFSLFLHTFELYTVRS